MADAIPSGPGARNLVVKEDVRPEPNLLSNQSYVKRADGQTVKRTLMTNGNVQDEAVFPGDFEDHVISEAAWKKQFQPSAKAAKKDG